MILKSGFTIVFSLLLIMITRLKVYNVLTSKYDSETNY